MNTKTTISVKVDKKLKQEAEETARRVGLPLGTVVNGFLRNFVHEQRIEFSAPFVPNVRTRKIIEEALREHAAGKSFGPYESVEDMFDALDA